MRSKSIPILVLLHQQIHGLHKYSSVSIPLHINKLHKASCREKLQGTQTNLYRTYGARLSVEAGCKDFKHLHPYTFVQTLNFSFSCVSPTVIRSRRVRRLPLNLGLKAQFKTDIAGDKRFLTGRKLSCYVA
jgi:hypothetical protein